MALLWVEGFDKWGSTPGAPAPSNTPGIKYKAKTISTANIIAGRYGGHALRIDNTSATLQTPQLHSGAPDKTLICGLAFRSTVLGAGMRVMNFLHPSENADAVTYTQFSLELSATGASSGLSIRRGTTVLSTNSSASLTSNTWAYIEMKVYCDATSGTCNVYVNGDEVISYTGNTQHRNLPENTAYSSVHLSADKTSGTDHDYDDMYIADGSGSGVTDVLGPCQVESLSPASDVSGNWTPSTGPDLYDNVNSQEADSDFISTDTSGNRAIFELDNLTANAALGTIKGAMLNAESEQLTASVMYAKALTQNGSGGSVQHTGNYVPGAGGVAFSHSVIMEDDPDGNAWTANTVNQLRVGVEAS